MPAFLCERVNVFLLLSSRGETPIDNSAQSRLQPLPSRPVITPLLHDSCRLVCLSVPVTITS